MPSYASNCVQIYALQKKGFSHFLSSFCYSGISRQPEAIKGCKINLPWSASPPTEASNDDFEKYVRLLRSLSFYILFQEIPWIKIAMKDF